MSTLGRRLTGPPPATTGHCGWLAVLPTETPGSAGGCTRGGGPGDRAHPHPRRVGAGCRGGSPGADGSEGEARGSRSSQKPRVVGRAASPGEAWVTESRWGRDGKGLGGRGPQPTWRNACPTPASALQVSDPGHGPRSVLGGALSLDKPRTLQGHRSRGHSAHPRRSLASGFCMPSFIASL